MFLAQTGPDEAVVVALPQMAGHRTPPFHLGLQDPVGGTEILSGSFSPDSLAGTLRALKAGARLYELEDFGDLAKPKLQFVLQSTGLTDVTYWRGSESVKEEGRRALGNRPRDWLEDLFQRVRHYVWDLVNEDEVLRRILGKLTPSALAILQFIYQEERVWYDKIVYTLGPSLPNTKASIEDYLDEAVEVMAPVRGIRQTLVSWKEKEALGPFTFFAPAFPALREIILSATPGRFGPEDLPYLTAAGRLQALEGMAQVAGSREERWDLLDLLENEVSRSTAAAFVKSEAGQAFLRGLEGDDREYARLLLEDLPGCKRLVRSLLGSDSQTDSEPTPPAEGA